MKIILSVTIHTKRKRSNRAAMELLRDLKDRVGQLAIEHPDVLSLSVSTIDAEKDR